MSEINNDTIVAIATPPGRGGVGVVRVSGPLSKLISKAVLGKNTAPRIAEYLKFKDHLGDVIDQGIAINFVAPQSFTGEDVLELQAHGGPVVLDMLVQTCIKCGARIAHPGEFTERAFLNNKIDLIQAEAIADLIESNSIQAAKKAVQTLDGVFSSKINGLVEDLIKLRIYIEAALDFPEEEIDFLSDSNIQKLFVEIQSSLKEILKEAEQGVVLQEGAHVVIVGLPNAGKSSLLNILAGKDSAIVTNIPGTTRDVLREQIIIDGLVVHITDTAGLRNATDEVEQIGIERAAKEIDKADLILLVIDSSETEKGVNNLSELWPTVVSRPNVPVIIVRNKSDLSGEPIGETVHDKQTTINICAKNSDGVDHLKKHIKQAVGFTDDSESGFLARRRHLQALEKTADHLKIAKSHLRSKTGELLAEELKQCQNALSEITGEFSSDDLLGKIFTSFCIGK